MLINVLKELNFSEKEVAIYLTLLEVGQEKAGEIAKKAGITRTTVYDILDALLKKGLVNKYKKGAATYYAALDPNRLLTYIDREIESSQDKLKKQKEEVKNLLPELISRQNVNNAKPKVQFYEGEKGMREAYEDTLTAKNGIIAYANVQTMHEGLPNFFPTYYKRRSDADVFIRAILPQNKASNDRADRDQEEKRQSRFLPEDKTFSPEVNIYNDKMLIASWKEKMAVIIESKELADFHRIIFEELWQKLPR